MIGSVAPLVLGLLPIETIDEIYGAGPDVILAGVSTRRVSRHPSRAATG